MGFGADTWSTNDLGYQPLQMVDQDGPLGRPTGDRAVRLAAEERARRRGVHSLPEVSFLLDSQLSCPNDA
jgi:hypothetical protein